MSDQLDLVALLDIVLLIDTNTIRPHRDRPIPSTPFSDLSEGIRQVSCDQQYSVVASYKDF